MKPQIVWRAIVGVVALLSTVFVGAPAMGALVLPVPPEVNWHPTTCSSQSFDITEPLVGGVRTYKVKSHGVKVWQLSLAPNTSDSLTFYRPDGEVRLNLVIVDKKGNRVSQLKTLWPDCPEPTTVSWTKPTCKNKQVTAHVTVPEGGREDNYMLKLNGLAKSSAHLEPGQSQTLEAPVKVGVDYTFTITGDEGTAYGPELKHKLICPSASATPNPSASTVKPAVKTTAAAKVVAPKRGAGASRTPGVTASPSDQALALPFFKRGIELREASSPVGKAQRASGAVTLVASVGFLFLSGLILWLRLRNPRSNTNA